MKIFNITMLALGFLLLNATSCHKEICSLLNLKMGKIHLDV